MYTTLVMKMRPPGGDGIRDIFFFIVFAAYVWVGIDPRLIYHWQAPVFYTMPGFLDEFLKYPGGPVDYLYALIAQSCLSRTWGALALTAQVAAVTALSQVYWKMLAGRALPLARFIPAALLLYFVNLYYDQTPVLLALLVGLSPAILFQYLLRRWRSEAALAVAFLALAAPVYYLGGMAIVFFAPAAAIAHMARRPRFPAWIGYLLLAAALPAAVELTRLIYLPTSARDWFTSTDARRVFVFWSLFLFYPLAAAIALRRPPPVRKRSRLVSALASALPILGLCCVAAASYRLNERDHRRSALDYYSFSENWSAVLDAARHLAAGDFNSLTRYEVNLALHETNRLGDEMFRYPQAGSMLLDLRVDSFQAYMVRLTDMCLRLGRVNEAEHYSSEALIAGRSDPRFYRLMARIGMIKGQMVAARKYLTVLSYGAGSGRWAQDYLRRLDDDPQLAGDPQIQLIRRRMLRRDDMLQVWQRGDKAGADMERLLLDQLEQDPSNRMAFEFLMGNYLLARDGAAVSALMPRIKDMTGPAYVGPGGRRRTPLHYQEAMAIFADMTGKLPAIEGLEVEPETIRRMAAFKQLISQFPSKDAARAAAWDNYRNTYFFYALFGPGDYR
jgi:hypothetical protein